MFCTLTVDLLKSLIFEESLEKGEEGFSWGMNPSVVS
jgi:hypothetical protein